MSNSDEEIKKYLIEFFQKMNMEGFDYFFNSYADEGYIKEEFKKAGLRNWEIGFFLKAIEEYHAGRQILKNEISNMLARHKIGDSFDIEV